MEVNQGEVRLANPGAMRSVLNVLNVGDGDTKYTFDPDKPAEREIAAKVVGEMLRAGFAIFVVVGEREGKPLYQRIENFDPATCEYLIVGTPPQIEGQPTTTKHSKTQGRKGRAVKRVQASSARAIAVAPSAGG